MKQPMVASPRGCSMLPSPAVPAFLPPEASRAVGPMHHGAAGLGPGPGQGSSAWSAHEDTAWPAQEDMASLAEQVTAWPVQEDTARPADADITPPVHEATACLMHNSVEGCGAVPALGPAQLGAPAPLCPSQTQPSMHQAWPSDSERSACPLLFDDEVADDALASVPTVDELEHPNCLAAAALSELPDSRSYGACAIVFDGSDEDSDWHGGAACMEGGTGLDPGQGVGSGATLNVTLVMSGVPRVHVTAMTLFY